MHDESVAVLSFGWIFIGVVGVVLLAGTFALIYWLTGRGRDDESAN